MEQARPAQLAQGYLATDELAWRSAEKWDCPPGWRPLLDDFSAREKAAAVFQQTVRRI
jgi:hypothetical protein